MAWCKSTTRSICPWLNSEQKAKKPAKGSGAPAAHLYSCLSMRFMEKGWVYALMLGLVLLLEVIIVMKKLL